jgi:hypothetical protein
MSIFKKSSRTFGNFRNCDDKEKLASGHQKKNRKFVTIKLFFFVKKGFKKMSSFSKEG